MNKKEDLLLIILKPIFIVVCFCLMGLFLFLPPALILYLYWNFIIVNLFDVQAITPLQTVAISIFITIFFRGDSLNKRWKVIEHFINFLEEKLNFRTRRN